MKIGVFKMKSNVYVQGSDLKNATLNAIDSGLHYSRQIFDSMDYPNYQTFHKNLYNLCRRGYIHKGAKKPRVYTLTKKGKFHLTNPNYFQEKKDMIFSKKLEAIMKNTDAFKSIMIKLGNDQLQNNIRGQNIAPTVVLPSVKSGSDFGEGENEDNDKVDDNNKMIIESLMKQVRLLKYNNAEIKEQKELLIENNQNLTEQIKSGNGTPKVNSNNNIQLANNRKNLTNQYLKNGGYLDLHFFEVWGIYPFLLKGAKIFNKCSIDILSKSNQEFERGHVKRTLTDSEIINSGMQIVKHDNNGIWVNCQGINKSKLLKFDRYSRTPQQVTQQMTQRPPQRRVIIKPSKRT